MRVKPLLLTMLLAAGCSHGTSGGGDGGATADGSGSCTDGCSDSQAAAHLENDFPPFGLDWTATGDAGRAGGLIWDYAGIDRTGLTHIYWIACDDTTTVCGLSLDGPVDRPSESWVYSATGSDLPNGKLVFTNATHILLSDGTLAPLSGRLTLTMTDGNGAIPFASVDALGVNARAGGFGAEIPGTSFQILLLAEVSDTSGTFTPYMDYYDAAASPDLGDAMVAGHAAIEMNGSFYDK